MEVNRDGIRANLQAATTEDLLDRVTVYREGMEPAALEWMEEELLRRGIGREAVAEHDRQRRETILFDERAIALKCHRCQRPAVVQTRSWHRLWGLVPLFRRQYSWCDEHRPRKS